MVDEIKEGINPVLPGEAKSTGKKTEYDGPYSRAEVANREALRRRRNFTILPGEAGGQGGVLAKLKEHGVKIHVVDKHPKHPSRKGDPVA